MKTYFDKILCVTFTLTGRTRMTDDGLMLEVSGDDGLTSWWSKALVARTFGE
jgi:hypothetical protein